MSNKAHELVCRDVTEIAKTDMVFNFGMLNNSAFKKAINNFGKFYSLKNIDRNIKICLLFMPLVYFTITCMNECTGRISYTSYAAVVSFSVTGLFLKF